MKKKVNFPQIERIQKGKALKVYQIMGDKKMKMPQHICSKEAIIIIQKGSALLDIDKSEVLLQKNDTFIIPAARKHDLTIIESFQAYVIMGSESDIQFVNK